MAETEEILQQQRQHMLARLTAERAYLMRQFLSLDEETLSRQPVVEGWTAKDLLAHIGVWDAFHTERMSKVLDGRIQEIQELGGTQAVDAHNLELYTQYKTISFDNALAILLKERRNFMGVLARVPDDELYRRRRFPWGWRSRMSHWVRLRWRHDAIHADHLAQWRQTLSRKAGIGPKPILPAFLRATRHALWATVALDSQPTHPVAGRWTAKDVIGHLADWEQFAVTILQQFLAGETVVNIATIDIQTWNEAQAAKRDGQPWTKVAEDCRATRRMLLNLLDQLPPETLARSFTAPWNQTVTLYRFIAICGWHDMLHAKDLRQALALKRWPKRLMI